MQDALLILRAGYAYKTVDNLGVVTSYSAAVDVTADGNTGFFAIANPNRTPHRGLRLEIVIPGNTSGQVTTTGGPTPIAIQFTVTFSDDGTNAVGNSIVSKSTSVTIASNVGTAPGLLHLALPEMEHKYLKVAWATTVTGGSSPTYNWKKVDVALVTESDRAGGSSISTDIG